MGLLLGLLVVSQADASVMLRIDGNVYSLANNNGATVSYTAASGSTPTDTYNFSGSVDGFFFNVTVDTNSPTAGANVPLLQSTDFALRNSSSSTGNLQIDVTDTAFTYPQRPTAMLVTNQIISATSSSPTTSISFRSGADPSKTPFGTAATTAAATPGVVFTPSVVTNARFYTDGSGYSLSNFLTVTNVALYNNVAVTGQTSAIATPEPGSLIAAATGLPMLMLAGWYRRRNSTRA